MKKILVTGASSFLGHHVMPILCQFQASTHFRILSPSSKDLNLLDRTQTIEYITRHKPNTILHMAALCGGIGANKDRPGDFILENTKMTTNLFDAIKEVNSVITTVTHFYGLGSVCGYPKHCPVPFKEDDIWNGYPEETNAPYGTAKRHMMVTQDAHRKQYGLKGAHLIPVNLYGPNDHFDLKNSHVIPALINKFITARDTGEGSVEVWGDGTPTREFLYAGDCALAIVQTVVHGIDHPDPINIGTGQDISIRDLAYLIREVVGFEGELKFTGEVSVNGQPQRRLDVSRAQEVLGFKARTDLKTGLKKTVAWYQKSNSIPVKETMQTTELTERRAEALSKLNRVINLLEKNTEDVFDMVQNDPTNTKTDYALHKYLGLLNVAMTRVQVIRNEEFKDEIEAEKPEPEKEEKQNVKIESEILNDPGPSIFVKATVPDAPKYENPPRMQELVQEIRDAIGDQELLERIAMKVDAIKPDLADGKDALTEENKDFLMGLIARVQRAKPVKFIPKASINGFEKDVREHLKNVSLTEKAIKSEEIQLERDIMNARERLEDRREKFLTNVKEVNTDTGEVKVLEHTAVDVLSGKHPLEELPKDKICSLGKTDAFKKEPKNPKRIVLAKDQGKVNPQEFLLRAGMTQEQIEKRLREEQRRKAFSDRENVFNFSKNEKAEKMQEVDSAKLNRHVEKLNEMAQKMADEKPKHNTVRRLNSSGCDVVFEKKPNIQESLNLVAKSMEEARAKAPKAFEEVIKEVDAKSPPPAPKERSLNSYESNEKFKSEKAKSAVIECDGGGAFRRSDNPKVKSGKRLAKHLCELEDDFFAAIANFEKEYGIPVFEAKHGKRGKRISGNFYGRARGITDTEIMAAQLISDKITPPGTKLNHHHIACPKKNDGEAKKPNPKPQPKVNDVKVVEEALKIHKKVEKPKKPTIFSTAKKVVSNLLKIVKS